MRFFYVRPSDNGNYSVEDAVARLLQPPEEVHVALFRGFRVPLEAVNFSPEDGGFANLNRYELVILAGLDPVVLSPADHLALVAFVERGGGLVLFGGNHSFGNAEGTYLPLDPILPVKILRGLDLEVNAMPRLSAHPIARGLPEPLGYLSKVHPVEPKPGAQVAMHVGDAPLVVTGEYGYGRVVVVASYPECEESEYGWFFTGDAFDDFLRGVVAWMRKEREQVWIEAFSLVNRRPLTGNEVVGKLRLGASSPKDIQIRTRLAAQDGRVVHESAASVQVKKTQEALFSFRVPDDPRARGLHYVVVSVWEKGTGPFSRNGLQGASQKRDLSPFPIPGSELARRDVAVEVVNPTRAAIEFEYGRRTFLPGESARVAIHATTDSAAPPAELVIDLALLDGERRPVGPPKRRVVRRRDNGYEDLELGLAVPRLRPGTYFVRLEVRVGAELADLVEEAVHVLAPSRAQDGFGLIAEGGYHLDRATTESSVRDLAAAGVTTLSLPGPPTRPWGESPHRELMLGHAEECAARAGLSVAHHRRGLVPGLGGSGPLAPCPLTQEFRQALEREVRPLLVAAARVPALGFHEMAPRGAVRAEQLCGCAACRAAYRRSLGGELPTEDAATLDLATRRALSSFVSSYWWHVYSAVQRLRDEAARGVKLALTLDATSFLRDERQAPYCDALAWAKACDVAEVATEPDIARFRLSLAGHRAVLSAVGRPFGALVDVGQGSMAPAEAAFLAIAEGATHLRVAENPRFLFFSRQPPLRDAVGGLFARLGRAGPLLARATRPPARVALLFPFTEGAVRGTPGLLAAWELLHAALGEADLLHERLVTEDGLASYGALAILGTAMLPKRVAAAAVRFVERGGLLLVDRTEFEDEDGSALAWPEGFFGSAETPVFETVSIRRRRHGLGRTTVFSCDVVAAHERAVVRGDAVGTRELRRAVSEAVAEHGVRPRARSADPDVEVGVRVHEGTWLLVAVSHSDEARTARIELDGAAAPMACAFDLLSGEEVAIERGAAPSLAVRLAPRDGGIWALYPERPFTLRLEVLQAVCSPGGSLRFKATVVNEAGQPAQGSHILRIAFCGPEGREGGKGDRYVLPERPEGGFAQNVPVPFSAVTAQGVLEVVEPLAANETPGRWTLTVADVLTRRVVRRSFEIAEEAGSQ
jgi:hypothetical protein